MNAPGGAPPPDAGREPRTISWRPPGRLVRRVLIGPAVLLLAGFVLVTLPVWLLLSWLVSPLFSGRLRPLRVAWMAAVYLILEAVALTVMFVLWVASGFGWKVRSPAFQRAHYLVAGAYLRVLFSQVRWALRLTIDVTGREVDETPDRPLLVFSRHAGPGDSFILVHALLNWYSREPRIVLKDTLQWDPAVDVVLNRLPSHFLLPDPDRSTEEVQAEIGRLATGLDHNDVFVIFPEGGNFTPRRRVRAIWRLRARGLRQMAAQAESMHHVLAPHPGGVLAALDAAPDADVEFVAHTGLDHLVTVRDIWRELPMDKTIVMRWWRIVAADIPTGADERVRWLYDWWARIDGWIDEHRPNRP